MAGLIIHPQSGSPVLGPAVPPRLEQALSFQTNEITRLVARLLNQPSPASLKSEPRLAPDAQPLETRLFDALAAVKILTAQVAMHLDRVWRDKLFQQLDALHDPEEWEDSEEPIQSASFQTFLKAILSIKPERRPGLGLSYGHLIAAWTTGRERLTIEFFPNDEVRWVLSQYPDDEPMRIAGQMSVSRLIEALSPYNPERWFCREFKSDKPTG
jgi:hypothetical protein